jgi:type IV secretion system protein VirB5
MKGIKGSIVTLVLLTSGFASNAANAGIPVIDVANLMQAIQEVLSWAQQQVQMVTQIKNQVSQITNQATQIERISGSRNLGQVFNNPQLQQVVPANVPQVVSALGAQGFNGLTGPAQALRTATMIYNCLDRPAGAAQTSCQAPLSINAQAQSWQSSALSTATARVGEIQSMQQQINSTTDPMAIAQVQAALAAETAQVANDQNRIALMHQALETARASAAQALMERDLAMMVPNAATSADNLVFP